MSADGCALRAYRRAPSRTSTFRPEHIQQTGGRPRSVPSTGRVDREQGQAHLPAEQPPPGTHARLPAADAHPGRARHPRRSPPQGPRAAIGLTRPRRCCRPAPGSPVGTSSPRPSAGGDASAALDWSSTSWCPLPPRIPPTPRRGRVCVVSRAVGGSVVRHRVARRLRHLLGPRMVTLPAGSRLVVRALPAAADAPSSVLGDDLDSGLRAVLRRTGTRS